MSRATSDIGDGDFFSTVANGDTIITSANDAIRNIDQFGGTKVNSIGVGTVMWSYNVDVGGSKIVAGE